MRQGTLQRSLLGCVLQVFLPLEERPQWDTRLLGPALRCAGGGRRQLNPQLHQQIWGTEYVRGPGVDIDARPQPDDLLKFVCAGAWVTVGLGWRAAGGQATQHLPSVPTGGLDAGQRTGCRASAIGLAHTANGAWHRHS